MLVGVLADGKPHSNAEIRNRIGLGYYDSQTWSRVRKYLRNRGTILTYEDGFWTMSDQPVRFHRDTLRRDRSFYSELVTRYRSAQGGCVRNPSDQVLASLRDGIGVLVFAIGQRINKTPTEIADDMKVIA